MTVAAMVLQPPSPGHGHDGAGAPSVEVPNSAERSEAPRRVPSSPIRTRWHPTVDQKETNRRHDEWADRRLFDPKGRSRPGQEIEPSDPAR